MTFDIRQLRYAVAAQDHGSFYRAALALSIEQSTLSRSVLKLERSIGMSIFERSRSGVTTTLAGKSFIHGAKPIIASADKLLAMTRAAGQGRAGGLKIGHNSSLSAGNLRATMMNWREENPDVEVECVEADGSALLAGLNTNEIDIAILIGIATRDGFRSEPLWSERMQVALPTNHKLAKCHLVHWTDLQGETFHLPAADPGTDFRDMLLGRLAASGAAPHVQMRQCSRETILSMLGGGLAVSIVCECATGASYPDIVFRPIHGEQGPTVASYAGYWRDDNGNPVLRRFLGFIKTRYALPFELAPKAIC